LAIREQALGREPTTLIYEQDADGEARYVYYGQTERNRLIAIVLTERNNMIRVITAYGLDAGQKRDYLERRARGSEVMRQQKAAMPKLSKMPKFLNEDKEAKWWASAEGAGFSQAAA
jgi:uncharacterized DUF497 family protein